ncbi:MAG: DeoR/GlpR transcriptional regulator [Anaerolineae bacterium]|nr:DeoR/GlpR transcriptional regulator [Anaerolineae bacterium]
MYLEERRQEILRLLTQQGRISVAELSLRFNVSGVTIRADLQSLAERGLIIRTHGGAIPINHRLYEVSLIQRRKQQILEKRRIGEAAAQMVADGEAIFLDSSSTVLAITPYLKHRRDLTVITNSLMIAQEMLGVLNITVVMPGGTMHHDTVSLIDTAGLTALEKFNIQKGFFGAYGLDFSAGFTDVSIPDSKIKCPLVQMCQQVFVLLDATKWNRAGLAPFADVQDVDMIITDSEAPADFVARVRAIGVEVKLV